MKQFTTISRNMILTLMAKRQISKNKARKQEKVRLYMAVMGKMISLKSKLKALVQDNSNMELSNIYHRLENSCQSFCALYNLYLNHYDEYFSNCSFVDYKRLSIANIIMKLNRCFYNGTARIYDRVLAENRAFVRLNHARPPPGEKEYI